MYLSAARQSAIQQTARSNSVEGNPEELVKDALEAITYCDATDAAYSVAEAAGCYELVPGVWYRKENELDATQARAILTQAKADQTYEAPIPEDDAKAVEEATSLVEMAQTAWNQYVRGPEVESILKIAEATLNGNGAAPAEPEATAPPAEPEPEPDPEGAAQATPPTETVAETGADEPVDLAQVEPWDGYEAEKAADIQKGIEAAVTEYDEAELRDLLANVWAYEHAHKRRVGIIGTLTKAAEKLEAGETGKGATDTTAPAEPAEPETPATPDPEPETKPEPEEPVTPEPETAVETETPAEPQPTVKETIEQEPSDYAKLRETVDAELRRDRLVMPTPPPQDDIPELPWDITKVGNGELQQLHWAYAQLAYYKAFIVQYEDRMATHCKQAADEIHRDLLNASDKYDENGKEKRVSILEAEIEADDAIVSWRRQQRRHEIFSAQAKQERDAYQKLVEQMSRIHTMRQDEWEQSGQKIGRGRPGS